jgi:hypothetical protein
VHIQHQKEIIVFNVYGKSAVLLNYRGYYRMLSGEAHRQVMPYILRNKLKPLPDDEDFTGKNISFRNQVLTTPTDTISIISPKTASTTRCMVIVTDNATPERMFSDTTVLPLAIVLDGSNNWSTLRRWQRFCSRHRITLHATREEGSVRETLE